jgi:hypothetical protein
MDVGIDAGNESVHNRACIGRIALPLGLPIAPVPNQACDSISWNEVRSEDFRQLAGSGPPPKIKLKKPVNCGDVALSKEQIIAVLGVDMWNAPTITENLDRPLQPG